VPADEADNRGWENVYQTHAKSLLPWERENTRTGKASIVRVLLDFGIGRFGLEVGCGRGQNILSLTDRGFEMHGIDVSSSAVQQARSPSIRVGTCLALEFKDESFDFVLDVGCFQHVLRKNRNRYKSEAWRVLKRGGLIGLSCFSDQDFYSAGRKWAHSKYGLFVSYSNFDELEKLFKNKFQLLYLQNTSWNSGIGRTHSALNLVARKS
jgi:SAM-dependent methyltransferase